VPRARLAGAGTYQTQLRESIAHLLPSRSLSLIDGRRWADRILVTCAILLAWAAGDTLAGRFAAARDAVVKTYPSRRRPGKTYAGFMAALTRRTQALLPGLVEHLRGRTRELSGARWQVGRWVVFGGDSSKLDCPMTVANERGLGCASRAGSWPQMVLATLVHLGSGLPWDWRLGGACASERDLLRQMIEDLPAWSMIAADAGFVGYEFFRTLLACGHQFVIRAGANVRLIERLGYALREHEGIVYVWPADAQKRRVSPLVLRRVTVVDGRNRRMVLLTSVLDTSALSDAEVLEIYCRRWGVELFYRTLKQTLGRGKLLSDSPAHAEVEGQWAMVGIWVLGLALMREASAAASASASASSAAGVTPPGPSVALALAAVRDAMAGRIKPGRRQLRCVLRGAMKDAYVRSRPKAARHWPRKKNPRPPGEPQARTAEQSEVLLAQQIRARRCAETIAA
jgi:hypothetical protein